LTAVFAPQKLEVFYPPVTRLLSGLRMPFDTTSERPFYYSSHRVPASTSRMPRLPRYSVEQLLGNPQSRKGFEVMYTPFRSIQWTAGEANKADNKRILAIDTWI